MRCLNYIKISLLLAFFNTEWLAAQTLDIARLKASTGYVILLGEPHNHFSNPLNYTIEGDFALKRESGEFSNWSIPASVSLTQLYSDDVRKSYVSRTVSLKVGISYRFEHLGWYATKLGFGLSESIWNFAKLSQEIMMDTPRIYTTGLYSEISEEFSFTKTWAGSFFFRVQYPEMRVYSFFLELGLGLIYAF